MSEIIAARPDKLVAALDTRALEVGGRGFREGRRDNFTFTKDFGDIGDQTGESVLFSARRIRETPFSGSVFMRMYVLSESRRRTIDVLPPHVVEAAGIGLADLEEASRFEVSDSEQYSLCEWFNDDDQPTVIEISREREYRMNDTPVDDYPMVQGVEATNEFTADDFKVELSDVEHDLVVAEPVFKDPRRAIQQTPFDNLDEILANPSACMSRVQAAAVHMHELLAKFLEQ